MEFRILGPLEVIACGRSVRLGRSREQKILAALLLDANRVVSLSRLVDVVWDNHPPKTASKVVRNCVSALRQRLVGVGGPDGVIVTDPAGYALRVPDGGLDLQVFRHKTARARRLADAGQLAEAARLLRTATALWRGPVLAGVSGQLIERAAAALNEQRLATLEECLSYELALGGREELVAELSVLVAEHPLRESLRGQLMVALHRCGRRTDALEVYRQGRRILIDELGLEPGVELREVEQAILNDDRRPARTVTPNQPQLPVPAQLPADVDGFVGRADHLARLAGHWQARSAASATTVAVTVIVGPPGIGKPVPGI
jgi:DNA-binding SARP family transcriptional activator